MTLFDLTRSLCSLRSAESKASAFARPAGYGTAKPAFAEPVGES